MDDVLRDVVDLFIVVGIVFIVLLICNSLNYIKKKNIIINN